MLVSSKEIILRAQAGKYAIGCFNTSDLEITKAIIAAAESQKSPVIVATSPKAIEYAGLKTLAAMIKSEAGKAVVPVTMHLDHGNTIELLEDCLDEGYTSVMIDGSAMELKDNVALTLKAAELAHAKDVACEGELGHLGKAGINRGQMTDPSEVAEFVLNTGVDFLAVSVGSSHGIAEEEPLDIELLQKIKSTTDVPLVLHGASGVTAKDVKSAIANGVAKINIDTDIRHTFVKSIRAILAKNAEENDPREIMTKVMIDIQKLVEEKIILFGSDNKV